MLKQGTQQGNELVQRISGLSHDKRVALALALGAGQPTPAEETLRQPTSTGAIRGTTLSRSSGTTRARTNLTT